MRVKAKTRGSWQATVSSGSPDPVGRPLPTYWVFVDLGSSPRASFVVPDRWIREDIHQAHQAYLDRNGGRRAENDDSQHHSIGVDRIERWRDQWQLLGGGAPPHATN